jgi:hypothetical protein
MRRGPKGQGTWVYDSLSPLEKGGEGVGSGGDGKRDILGSYRLKRRSVPGNDLGGKGYSGLESMSGCKDDLPPFSAVGGIRA